MAINVKCPKCGSTKVQLSDESKKHGCLWLILFGWLYVIWVMIKWMIGAFIFMFYDWQDAKIEYESEMEELFGEEWEDEVEEMEQERFYRR